MWAIGCFDLGLGEDWMERLTMQEWEALYERKREAYEMEDYFHSRTAASTCGKAPKDLMIFRPERKVLHGPDGKPIGVNFDDLIARNFSK